MYVFWGWESLAWAPRRVDFWGDSTFVAEFRCDPTGSATGPAYLHLTRPLWGFESDL